MSETTEQEARKARLLAQIQQQRQTLRDLTHDVEETVMPWINTGEQLYRYRRIIGLGLAVASFLGITRPRKANAQPARKTSSFFHLLGKLLHALR